MRCHVTGGLVVVVARHEPLVIRVDSPPTAWPPPLISVLRPVTTRGRKKKKEEEGARYPAETCADGHTLQQ